MAPGLEGLGRDRATDGLADTEGEAFWNGYHKPDEPRIESSIGTKIFAYTFAYLPFSCIPYIVLIWGGFLARRMIMRRRWLKKQELGDA